MLYTIFELIFVELIIGFFRFSGEILSYVFTFGKKKMTSPFWRHKKGIKPLLSDYFSIFLGLFFWIILFVAINNIYN